MVIGLSRRREEGMVALLGDISPHDQILPRSSDPVASWEGVTEGALKRESVRWMEVA